MQGNNEEAEIIGKRTSDDDLVQNEQTNRLISSEQVKIFEQAQSLQGQLSLIEKELQTEPSNEKLINERTVSLVICTLLTFLFLGI